MVLNSYDLQLRALRYPHQLDLSSPESARKLVVWLENLKIREYKIEDRKPLTDIQSPSWDAAFKKYLCDLECPLPAPPSSSSPHLRPVLEWLLAFALNLDYEDNADKLGASGAAAGASPAPVPAGAPAAAAAAGRPAGQAAPHNPSSSSSSSRDGEAFDDLGDPRVAAAVERLVAAAGVPPPGAEADTDGGGGGDLASRLQAAAERLVCGVGPALSSGGWSEGRPARQALAGVPLGFELPDESLATAATVLRLLYIRDLRGLQTQIDHALVEMQEYTANPRTDASLGKIGR